MMPREKWTDDRLGDLNKKVDEGFARLDKRIDGLDKRINGLDEDIKNLGKEMNARFESLNRNLQATMVAVIVALIGSNAF